MGPHLVAREAGNQPSFRAATWPLTLKDGGESQEPPSPVLRHALMSSGVRVECGLGVCMSCCLGVRQPATYPDAHRQTHTHRDTRTHPHTHACTDTHRYRHTHIQTHMRTHTDIHTYRHTHKDTHAQTPVGGSWPRNTPLVTQGVSHSTGGFLLRLAAVIHGMCGSPSLSDHPLGPSHQAVPPPRLLGFAAPQEQLPVGRGRGGG